MADFGIARWVMGKVMGLPARQTRRIQIDKNLAVPMRDGVTLLADHHYNGDAPSGPLVLIRSCYGRDSLFGMMASLMAERGLQVIIQSVRGTSGSGGQLNPMHQEQPDGEDTLNWLEQQPFYSGQVFTFGPSYLGNTQWAMAHGNGHRLSGLNLMMTLSNFSNELLAGKAYTLEGTLGWTKLMQPLLTNSKNSGGMSRPDPDALKPFFDHLPIGDMDKHALGTQVPWWQDWTQHANPNDEWWQGMNFSAAAAQLDAPTNMIAGWQDVFLPFQMNDFCARQAAGKPAWITIGPWNHASMKGMGEGLKQSIEFFTQLASKQKPGRPPVRLYLQQANQWMDFSHWPPQQSQAVSWYLHGDQQLSQQPPEHAQTSLNYRFDPKDPTPSLHGPTPMGGSKVRDMSELEQRSDTISFSGPALTHDCDVVGPVAVTLSVKSNREHTDFFVCLCDMDKKGRPIQVSDGFLRLRPTEEDPSSPAADKNGVRTITIDCWPTAYRFKRGHRLQVIVASGAFPRYNRNLGHADSLGGSEPMLVAEQSVVMGGDYQPYLQVQQLTS